MAAKTARWRMILAWVLVVLAAVLTLVGALDIWVKRQTLDTNNWVDTSGKLLENQKITNALSVYMVNQLYDNVDVQAALEQRLPNQLDPLSPVIASGLRPALVRVAQDVLQRPKVQQLWKLANRRAHQEFIEILDNKNELLKTTNGNVVLDLHPIIEQLEQRGGLGAKLAQQLPPDAGQLVIMKSKQIDAGRKVVKAIRIFSVFLAIIVLALFALAVWLARGRRRVIILGSGISLVLAGLLILVARRFLGDYVVDALAKQPAGKDAAHAAWSIGTSLLRNIGINVLVYGIVIAVGAILAGPSRLAVAGRRWLAPTLRDHPVIVYSLVAFAVLIYFATGPTDISRLVPILFLFAFTLGGVAILRRQTAREFPEAGGSTPTA
jgi:hypothetical protein